MSSFLRDLESRPQAHRCRQTESARAAPLRADEADARLRERLAQAEATGGARVRHDETGRAERGLSSREDTEAMTAGKDTVT